MAKKFYFLILFFISFFALSLSFINADEGCLGCSRDGSCYYPGGNESVIFISGLSYYCSSNGSFVRQKAYGQGCIDNFECNSSHCIQDTCVNYQDLLNQYQSILTQTANYSAYLSTSCSASPGCLNVSNFTNAHTVMGLCANNYNCFQCNVSYSWSGSACISGPPSSTSGDNPNSNSGGGWTTTRNLTNAELSAGVSFSLYPIQRVGMLISSGYYYLGVLRLIRTEKADLKFFSNIPDKSIMSSEKIQVDINLDGRNDIEVTLTSIAANKATFYAKLIQEQAPVNPDIPPVIPDEPTDAPPSKSKMVLWIIVSILLVAIIVVVAFIVYYYRKNPESQ